VKLVYRRSFLDDVGSLPKSYRIRLEEIILTLKSATRLADIHNVKKLEGYHDYFRIRLGEYRIGVKLEGDMLVLMRCLHRREIYRRFP
jgi:mRNA interferase RelE/StbE